MRRHLYLAAVVVGLGLTGARAARAHNFTGNNELGGMIGGDIGVDKSPGGLRLLNEYGYRLSRITWLNLQLNLTFGGGHDCVVVGRNVVDCDRFSGQALEMIVGAKFKFETRNPKLVPYAKVGGGLAFFFFPGPDNDGVAGVFRGGGGVKYYVAPSLAVGGEMDMEFGPGLFGCGVRDCTEGDFFFGLDIAGGIEWNF
jgi:hypothetical protein